MGAPKTAAHTLCPTKKSTLKRGKTYLFDAMNLLYSLCFISAIADLLVQQPAVPTRDLVRICLCMRCVYADMHSYFGFYTIGLCVPGQVV